MGATRYVAATTEEEFHQIKMNLNHDMLASPNFARFIYDGDFSDSPPPATAPDVNVGAAEIEKKFDAYFDSKGQASEPTAFDGRSDYKPFQDNGIAAGGLFTGAEVAKTPEQVASLRGHRQQGLRPQLPPRGRHGLNINTTGFEQMTDAAAFVLGTYATDPGFPARSRARRSAAARVRPRRPSVSDA